MFPDGRLVLSDLLEMPLDGRHHSYVQRAREGVLLRQGLEEVQGRETNGVGEFVFVVFDELVDVT